MEQNLILKFGAVRGIFVPNLEHLCWGFKPRRPLPPRRALQQAESAGGEVPGSSAPQGARKAWERACFGELFRRKWAFEKTSWVLEFGFYFSSIHFSPLSVVGRGFFCSFNLGVGHVTYLVYKMFAGRRQTEVLTELVQFSVALSPWWFFQKSFFWVVASLWRANLKSMHSLVDPQPNAEPSNWIQPRSVIC